MLWEHEPIGECFHSFYELAQTSPSVFYNSMERICGIFNFFKENSATKKDKMFTLIDHQIVNSLCSCHHSVSS